jgi:hypothetical protein
MKYLILALALCSCTAIPQPQGKIVTARPSFTPENAVAMRLAAVSATPSTAVTICPMTGDVPDFQPWCEGCYKGEGTKVDPPCIDAAEQAWNQCEQDACNRYRARMDAAAARRDVRLQAATDAYFACMLAANHDPVAEQACYDTAKAAVDAAWDLYNNVTAAYKLMYGMEVAACDMEYMASIHGCCIPCEPWDGWPEN